MKRKKISIRELSDRSGITRAYVYRILADQQNPSLEIASRLADAIDLTFNMVAKR